jgi:hypothetical protein
MTTSFIFTVTSRTSGTPVRLDGTTNDSSIKLQSLQIPKLGTDDRVIADANTQDKIKVTSDEFDALTNMSLPHGVTFTGTNDGVNFTVSSISVNAGLAPAMTHSDITSLLGAPAATGTEDA